MTAAASTVPAALGPLEEIVRSRRMFGLPDHLIRVAVSGPAGYEAFWGVPV